MPGGAGMAAPPSALEPPRVARAEGAPAAPVLARGTRQNEGRGGREERETGRGVGPLPFCFSPATRPAPTQARSWPLPVDGYGEDAAAGAWRRSSRGDRVLAPRTPTSRKPDTRVTKLKPMPSPNPGLQRPRQGGTYREQRKPAGKTPPRWQGGLPGLPPRAYAAETRGRRNRDGKGGLPGLPRRANAASLFPQ